MEKMLTLIHSFEFDNQTNSLDLKYKGNGLSKGITWHATLISPP
jgi:hypothetical protein